MRFKVIDRCPVPARLYPFLQKLQKESGCHFNSIYRGDAAATLLHSLGKHTQRELYQGWVRRLPGFNPANPPGTSTHELFSDGVAYPHVPRGRKLDWWQCGIDVNDSDVPKVKAAARKHGWTVRQPYPSGSEFHHLNFTRKPTLSVIRRIKRKLRR